MAPGTNGSTCTVNDNDGIKVGTSSKGGTMTITVGAGATKLTFYAAAWKGVNGLSLNISGATTSPASVALTADAGVSNNSPFTLSGSAEIYKHEISLSNITEETTLTFTTSTTKRFVIWGADYETGAQKAPAGLAYADADKKQLVKYGASFTAPTLSNENNLSVSYESDNTDVAEVATNGAVTIKALGKAKITASSEETSTYAAGSASYTICVVNHEGTEVDPFDVADARRVIDAFETIEGVYMSGIISQITTAYDATYHNISFDVSTGGTTNADQVRAYRCKGLNNIDLTSADDVKAGATVTVFGNLKKYNSTYEFDAGCYLTAYEGPAVPLVDITNTKTTAYTVSQALALTLPEANSDLTKKVFVKGVVYQANSFNSNNGTYNIYIREANKTEDDGKFEFYKCEGLYDEVLDAVNPFVEGGVLVGDTVIGYGTMTYFQTADIWEFSAGNYLVELIRPEVAVTSVELDQNAASIEIGEDVTLHATVNPDNASNKEITWSVQSGDDYVSIAEGVVTGIAAGEAVIRVTSVADGTKYAECTVTVTAPAPDDRYKAEQTGFDAISGKLTTVTEGAHQGKEYISYEAKQGGAQTAPSIQNTDKIRLYQNGGLLVIGAAKGCKIDQVFLTTGGVYTTTTIGYSKTETAIAETGEEVAKETEWSTPEGQNADTIVIVCLGADKNSRIDVAKLDVRYTGEPIAIHHYTLAGEYTTVFNQGDDFNHNGLIVYAAYDELGTDLVNITADCSFSAPNMNQVGEQTIEITYDNIVVQSYTITVNATETAKLKFYAPVAWGDNVKAFTWEGNNTGDHAMTAVEEGSRWFECDLEKNVPFLIYNGNWTGLNQTIDIAGLDADKCYAWTTSTGDEGKMVAKEVSACEMSYYIAGETLPEMTWAPDSKAMTNNEVEFENLDAGTYRFKITDGTWQLSLGYDYADQTNSNIALSGDNDGNVVFTTTAAMNVTIAYHPATEKITVHAVRPFVPNIKFGNAGTKINGTNVNGTDSYNNTWNVVTVPGAAGQSFTQSGEYSQVGSGSKPAESITFTNTLATSDEIASISYIAIKLGGFNGTVGNVSVKVDGTESASGVLNGSNDVVVESTNSIMGREISIEVSGIDKGVKCYGIEYAYQKYELAALKFFAPRDENNKWDNVYAYAYDPANNNQAWVAWPGEEVTAKDAEWYVYNAPKGFNVIFHDNDGMQTNDIENVQTAACYVPTSIDYTATPHLVTLAEQCTVDYYVAGDADFMAEWAPANASCKFDENNQVVFHDVPAGEYQFKITNGSWAWSIGGNEFLKNEEGCGSIAYTIDLGNTGFKIAEVQDITITYYPATREICLGAVTVKTTGELTADDIALQVDEMKAPSFSTNIVGYTAADVELTFVSGDECVEFVEGQIKGTAAGSAVVKVSIAETASFTAAESNFNVTVTAIPQPQLDPIAEIGGKFIINAKGDTAVFSRGNLQYQQSTQTWRCAPNQYDWAGEAANEQMGNAAYAGWVDLFSWSLGAENNYGATSAYLSTAYQNKDFVDWGGLFSGDWSTLSSAEWQYLLNSRSGANDKWGMAMIGDNLGMILLPNDWTAPAGVTFVPRTNPTSELWDEEDMIDNTGDHYRVKPENMPANKFTLEEWAQLEAAGAIFLPYAGRRSGGYGNYINRLDVEVADEYNFTYYENYLGTYWTSTAANKAAGTVNYVYTLKYQKVNNEDDYQWGKAVVWGENGRYGQSVRLVHIIPRQYAVTYDVNGAEGEAPVDGAKYLDGADVTLADASGLSKEGYVFAGWKFKGETYNGSYTINNVLANEEIVFEAQWESVWTTVREDLTVGNHYTVCLPKNVTDVKGATFWSLSYRNNEETFAYLVEETAPFDAAVPYVIQATEDKLQVVYGDESESEGQTNGALVGTLEELTPTVFGTLPGNIYIIKENALRPRIVGQNWLPAYRAYVNYDVLSVGEPTPAPGRRVKAMPLQKNTPTGIDALNASETPVKMLIDGQIYILRGEKIYDATGRLVK